MSKKVKVSSKQQKSAKSSKNEIPAYGDGLQFEETPQVGEFNGNPTLNFEPSKERYAVMMGVKKIRAVLEHIEECEAFVKSGGQTIDPDEVD
jgi:hypothetical protein